MQKHLTEQCLTIILLKKEMDTRDWPRLHKAGEMLPYIGTDFKRWSWEGDKSDEIINARLDSQSRGMTAFRAGSDSSNQG